MIMEALKTKNRGLMLLAFFLRKRKHLKKFLLGFFIGILVAQIPVDVLLKLFYLSIVKSTNFLYSNVRRQQESQFKDTCNYGEKGPRILCGVFTEFKSYLDLNKIREIAESYGKECTSLIYFSKVNQNETKLAYLDTDPNIRYLSLKFNPKLTFLTNRHFETFKFIYTNLIDEFDWFLKLDLDTFVKMDNLKYFLSTKCPNRNVTYGFNRKNYGVPGYVISREAIKLLGKNLLANNCTTGYRHDDFDLGYCIETSGIVEGGETRDILGKERFHCLSHDKEYLLKDLNVVSMHSPVTTYNIDYCSDTSISFHYVNHIGGFYLLLNQIKPVMYEINVIDKYENQN